MSTTSSSSPYPRPRDRALVLGGGGSTGNAWLIGTLAGLADAGLDVVPGTDLVIGTSAGATAAAQIAGSRPTDLLAAVLDAVPPRPAPGTGAPGTGRTPTRAAADQMARTAAIIASAHDPADLRRRLGAAALALDAASDGTWRDRWRAVVAGRFPGRTWPERTTRLTAVDAATGEPVTFDRDSGVDLVDAVAASCASGLPYRIGGRAYLDGGYRRNENADLAAGYARVLVLSPFGGASRTPPAWGQQLATQVDELRAGGSRVAALGPADADAHLFGANAMDPTLRPAAARAGYDHAVTLVERVAGVWG